MATALFTCPRCLYSEPLRSDMKFCPRCGLVDAKDAWLDKSPTDIKLGGRVFRVMERVAIGSVCSIYRCRFQTDSKQAEGVFKIARDACANAWVSNEADVLRRLYAADSADRFRPFLPKVEESLGMGDAASGTPRMANVLRMDCEIKSLEELYTLSEVHANYSAGLDPHHAAWIWRRLLSVLGYIHSHDVVHGAVLPMHILIDPKDHKLVLIDWCCAVREASKSTHPITIITGGYTSWFKREGALRHAPTHGLDIGMGARCMIELMGGDPVKPEFPPSVEPGLQRYFMRCVGADAAMRPDAWKLLDDFDRLIDAMWGKRHFRALAMPPKGGAL